MERNPYQELEWGNEPPLDKGPGGAEDKKANTIDRRYRSQSEADLCAAEVPIEPVKMYAGTTALVIVDVQPEYWSQCPAVKRDFPEFPENLKRTIETSRRQGIAKIIFVRADYRFQHSPWLVQFSRIHEANHNWAAKTGVCDLNPTLTEIVCDPESDSFQWEDFATPKGPHDVILPKSSWSSTSNTALIDHLRRTGIDTVMVCGLITSVCVQHSAFGLFEAGFRTLLVRDACADRGRARHDAAIALYGNYMYELITSHDLDNPEKGGLLKSRPLFLSLNSSASANNIPGLFPSSNSSNSSSSGSAPSIVASPYSSYNNLSSLSPAMGQQGGPIVMEP